MATWGRIQKETGVFAQVAQGKFDAHDHKTIATLRADGSPRISGTEAEFRAGELWIGSMWQARKALDLLRDPRFALHSATVESGDAWTGDAKLTGRMIEVHDDAAKRAMRGGEVPPGPFHLFRAEILKVVVVQLADTKDHLVIQLWDETNGLRTITRE